MKVMVNLGAENISRNPEESETLVRTAFMKAAPVGSWVQVESRVLRTGKTLAFCEVSLHDEASGKLLAKGRHTKYILPDTFSTSSS
ncbi:unnamed protein product [Hymenolepis diminuta]|uniref:4HBT domain-containing protein n=1 Tax=Hymenolepis diminuta TaxID=6216 RepID=A0A0R3SXG4_HYMDI|nr:unnamed protein product [Hymenolepis diminuta]